MNNLREKCLMRHENGNCTAVGGFCTAVNDSICKGLHNAYDHGYYDAAIRARQERRNEPPLTLNELRRMNGELVWDNFLMEYCVITANPNTGKEIVKYSDGDFDELSEKRFYRYKPKEDITE